MYFEYHLYYGDAKIIASKIWGFQTGECERVQSVDIVATLPCELIKMNWSAGPQSRLQ